MFFGEHKHKLDSKGRVSFPSKFRQKADGNLIVTRGSGEFLIAYTHEEWENYVSKFRDIPESEELIQYYIRDIYSYAIETNIDSAGRISLSDKLIEYAKIDKELYFIGKQVKVEIWSPEILESHRKQFASRTAEINAKLKEYGM